ncbi:MAG: BtaA family protein [Saprospiraceae bacterium]
MVKNKVQLKDWVFNQVHGKNLVYNTCWEDPRCDRQLLQLTPDSEVVMITSAGCNALDYLLDQPQKIHAIDVNPRQNALLELKKAVFKAGNYRDLFKLFGEGTHQGVDYLYQEKIRKYLPAFAQDYWDKNLAFFNGQGLRKSFYFYGTSGTFAWLAQLYFKARKNIYRQIDLLFQAQTLEEQRNLYEQIEPKLVNRSLRWMVNRHLSMCLIGVPRSQQALFVNEYKEGAAGFMLACLRHICTEVPIADNYFYHLYFYGYYTKDCCPSYLKETHFQPLRKTIDHLQTHTTTIANFLKENPGPYSHYVLLDHQDWLADHDVAALEEEWRLILANSRPGTRILLRSAAKNIDFFPSFVLERLDFEQQLTQRTHQEDRVGTYASVYLGIVK